MRKPGTTATAARTHAQRGAQAPAEQPAPRHGWLVTDGWSGRTYQAVCVEGETPRRYRVRAIDRELRLPFRGRGLRIVFRCGTVLVPKDAVTFINPYPTGDAKS